MAPARKRVSYIVPSPSEPVPKLQLPAHGVPRNGQIGPLLIPSKAVQSADETTPKWAQHPRHRLGVACLALDTSTQLAGRGSPEGILYSGGRDGLVLSWDLGIRMKKRSQKYGVNPSTLHRSIGRWEILTGWADDIIEEDLDEEDLRSDGDILGDVTTSRRRRKAGIDHSIPYEQQWETDLEYFEDGKITQFRQCAQVHSDWVNDILLCNYNQTVVTASSDGTVKAWNPHSLTEPSTIGTHADYVRCLTRCRDQNWIASGGFDRSIKLWDLAGTHNREPLITLHPPESSGPKSSVYALATDAHGSLIVSGSPERVIRMWDPRSGRRVGKLVGHTDNIRAIMLSEDAKYLLTGSADASVKLWSLSTQKCLHTFTYHTDSVWSLFSEHPSLEIFYSGDRSGLVCKVDVEGCSDVSEGECIVLCQDGSEHNSPSTEGINKIVAIDDNLLWTASGSSTIKRWKIPQRRALRAAPFSNDRDVDSPTNSDSPIDVPSMSPRRQSLEVSRSRTPPMASFRPSSSHGKGPRTSIAPSFTGSVISETSGYQQDREGEETWYGIPFESLVRLTSPNETFTTLGISRGRDPEIATLYSAASVISVPRMNTRSPLQAIFTNVQIPRSVSPIQGDGPQLRYTEDTLHPMRTARMEYEEREVAADAVPLHSVPDEIVHGEHGLVRSVILNDRMHALTVDTAGEVAIWNIVRGVCLGNYSSEDVAAASFCGSTSSGSTSERDHSPREALETVRERIEGEAVVLSWSSVDTKTGVLTVHLNERCFEAEIYADEAGYGPERHFSEETRLNIGKWVLRNLFVNFIKEEQRTASRRYREGHDASHRITRSNVSHSSHGGPKSATIITAPNMLPAVSPSVGSPLSKPIHLNSPLNPFLSPIPQSPTMEDTTPMPLRQPSSEYTSSSHGDYFSLKGRRPSVTATGPTTPDDFSGWTGPAVAKSPSTEAVSTPMPSTPGGLMGRLKAFGKGGKRQASEFGPAPSTPNESTAVLEEVNTRMTPLQVLLSKPLNPPTSNECPSLPIPANTTVLISEEAQSGWSILYRGQVSSTGYDKTTLEDVMPMWLLEFLLLNKTPPVSVTKVSFVLLPYPTKDPDEEQLPELLNTAQAKLTASRFLRVRKLTNHVQDKLEKLTGGRNGIASSSSPRSSVDARSVSSGHRSHREDGRPRAEDLFEILCNDLVLPLDMTLAVVRQYVWRQSNELVMHYRRKAPASSLSPPPPMLLH
ncbi:WD repeat WDR48 family protein [Abortiporus biennis]